MSTAPVVPPESHISFFQHVKAFFVGVEQRIHNAFELLFGAAGDRILADIEAAAKAGLVAVADSAVAAAATLTVDGAGKRAAAFETIKTTAVNQGVSLKDSIINLLIEGAVQKLKG